MKKLNTRYFKLIKSTTGKLHIAVKLALFSFILVCFITKADAQTNACGCVPITTIEYSVLVTQCDGCTLKNNLCPGCDVKSMVVIEYTKVDCGGVIAIMFRSATFVGPKYSGTIGYSNQQADYKTAQQAALQEAGGGSIMSFVYPAGCQTIAEVTYPSPALCYYFIPEGPNKGAISAIIDLGNPSPVLEMLPCDGNNCCKLDYTYDVNTKRYTLVNFNPIQVCPSVPPTTTTKSFTCYDINGNEVTYTGTITYPHPCESYCSQALNTLFKTSGIKEFKPLPDIMDFSLSPIPAHESVTFSSTKNISKIEIYDVAGKRNMEQSTFDNNIIDISKLAEGVHFVRIYFKDTSVRSIKILKQ